MVSRIIEFCAKNRILVLLAVGFATIAAVWSIRRIKLDAIPDLSDPQVIVYTEWMGRSPTLVEDQVTYRDCPIVPAKRGFMAGRIDGLRACFSARSEKRVNFGGQNAARESPMFPNNPRA